jgi:hypothetical protein
MKASLAYLIVTLLFIFSGCKDRDRLNEPCSGNCITITGKITTEHNSAVVAQGVSLKLSWARPAVPLGSPPRKIATTTTDEKGNYTFVFTPKSDELQDGMYLIEYSKEGFFPADIAFFDISRGDTTINQNIHIARKGKVRVIVQDFPINSSSDSINIATSYYNYMGTKIGTVEYDAQGQAISPNDFNVLEFTSEVAANQYTYFNIMRIANGQKTRERDSVFNEAGKETTYLYKY